MSHKSKATSRFFVEGADDFHAILALLKRHGLSRETVARFPKFQPSKNEDGTEGPQGKDAVLSAIKATVKLNPREAVGFVVDADDSAKRTWEAVASRLKGAKVPTPDGIPEEGFIGRADPYGTRVGVWIMPDNRRGGELEDFLQDLADDEHRLFRHAQGTTEEAKSRGATFPDHKTSKAVLHTWLAWQRNPGRPYGQAIESKYLRDDSEAAIAFVGWFRQLFALGG